MNLSLKRAQDATTSGLPHCRLLPCLQADSPLKVAEILAAADLRERLSWAVQLADALQELHARSITLQVWLLLQRAICRVATDARADLCVLLFGTLNVHCRVLPRRGLLLIQSCSPARPTRVQQALIGKRNFGALARNHGKTRSLQQTLKKMRTRYAGTGKHQSSLSAHQTTCHTPMLIRRFDSAHASWLKPCVDLFYAGARGICPGLM